jgi:hypothetical protein
LATQSIRHVPEHKHINHFSDHIARIQSYTYLANAIFHLSDQSALDERTHFITWPIPNRHVIHQKKYFLVRVIKNFIRKIDSAAEWGMIVAGDIGGTRYHSPRIGELGQAHLHAILILPLGFPVSRLNAALPLLLLRDSESDGNYITFSDIDFRPYQPDKPYWWTVDYFNKGEKYVPLDWQLSPYIYPADRFRRDRRQTSRPTNIRKIRSFDAEIDRVRDELLFDPRRFFSDLASCGLSADQVAALDQYQNLSEGERDQFKASVIHRVISGHFNQNFITQEEKENI